MIAENIRILQDRIARATERAGRNTDEVTLIAVSKTVGVPEVRLAMQAGLRTFGENFAQELRDKASEITDDVAWHFIGHLQTNKVKYVAGAASFIHSVDSVKLTAEIDKEAGKRQKVIKILLEIKTSDEESKHGVQNEDDAFTLADYCMKAEHLELCGLMTMAPFVDDATIVRNSFRSLRLLKEKMTASGYPVQHLSMGMTLDFEIAIEEGATMIRVGTAIFGERIYI
ncbi:MAG: YggS family pyridoxal phosphate-dependent enzyme [Ignavibacteriales bacterium]|nr:YggS family pyridoxal phosphate-dependent enzyme [Ignavibacteriales bacterium]